MGGEDEVALGVAVGERAERRHHGRVELLGLALEPVGLRRQPGQTRAGLDVEEHREIGKQRAGGPQVDLPDDVGAEAAADALGPIDVVIANAGQISSSTALSSDPDEFARNVQINLLGTQRLTARLGPAMVGRGHGDLVFVTSDVVARPRTHMAAYVAAKAGLEGLARAMQMELEGTGVRVGMVRPGPSSTEQGTDWDEATVLHIMPSWERWGHLRHSGALLPRNVADAIVAMVSTPKGTHLTLIEVQPEAPVLPDRSHQ